jgi:hypothetical protein
MLRLGSLSRIRPAYSDHPGARREIATPAPFGGRAIDRASPRKKNGFAALEPDDLSSNRHPAPAYWWSTIFSENRYPVFAITLYARHFAVAGNLMGVFAAADPG